MPTTEAYWIKSLYVSQAMHGGGVGRAAMDTVERMAGEALRARHLMLDALHRDDQLDEVQSRAYGREMPGMANQDWYARRGYRLVATIENFYDEVDLEGKKWNMRAVVMRRDL